MPRLPTRGSDSAGVSSRATRTSSRRILKAIMRSRQLRIIPKYEMPVRLRPWFLVFSCAVIVMLALLGWTTVLQPLPLNDKVLHVLCFGTATALFYLMFDVEENARHIWFWRNSPLMITGVVCFFFGGIISEVVQSLLLHMTIEGGDVVANLLGSTVGLYIAYHIERYYRHRREISRLYRPLDAEYSSDEDDDAFGDRGAPLLPLHTSRASSSAAPPTNKHVGSNTSKHVELSVEDEDDERQELFNVGDSESEDEDDRNIRKAGPPRIVVTPSG